MNAVQFRRLIAEAIASREPLDTEDFARLAIEAGDDAFWRSQVDLDRAIWAWNVHSKRRTPRRLVVRRVSTLVAAVAAGISVVWLARPAETVAPEVRIQAGVTEFPNGPIVAALPAITEPFALMPVVAPKPPQDLRLAEATATAERLAYAFQPVGEQVNSVVRLLIDAVPGSDVFAL
jgi:DNA-binding transcriptional LysR family regulator